MKSSLPGICLFGFLPIEEFYPPIVNSAFQSSMAFKMNKTVLQPPYSPDCDFWLFPKLRGCRYETIEEMKEALTKVIDTLTQENFHGTFQKLLKRYKCIAARGDYFEEGLEFHVCILNKSAHTKKVWKLI